MIYQIVDQATGAILRTVLADRVVVARLYLKDGEALFAGGPSALPRDSLRVVDGVIVAASGVAAAAKLNGRGDVLEAVDAQ